ncbi:MAG: hypothetical protein F6J89_16385 [Symploca sp. SIO1C4]|uniref:Transposase n=1 Tax=Symploca sp. SIO1C4 TaxID=2607765 RepID=A0A6B3NET9_9CYAN|nr:hypothetical protein [Symploca sp. SIO1C4]
MKRGLYRSAKGFLINADCNGAANIICKVAAQLNINLAVSVSGRAFGATVGSGSLALPQRYEVITDLSKSYRQQALRRAFLNPVATSA